MVLREFVVCIANQDKELEYIVWLVWEVFDDEIYEVPFDEWSFAHPTVPDDHDLDGPVDLLSLNHWSCRWFIHYVYNIKYYYYKLLINDLKDK